MSGYKERFEELYSADKNGDYASETMYYFMLNAPAEYGKEEEMLSFIMSSDASLRQVFDFFNEITPDGLSPLDDGEDLLVEGNDGD